MPWGFPVNSDSPSADLSSRPELGGFASADLEPVSTNNPHKDQAMAAKKKAKKKVAKRKTKKKATKRKAKKKVAKRKTKKKATKRKAKKKATRKKKR